MNEHKIVAAWWAIRRDRTLETQRPDLYHLYLDGMGVMSDRSTDSVRMFQLLYDATKDEDERADMVDEYIEHIQWRKDGEFIVWLRERSRFEGEVIRLLDLYDFPLHDD